RHQHLQVGVLDLQLAQLVEVAAQLAGRVVADAVDRGAGVERPRVVGVRVAGAGTLVRVLRVGRHASGDTVETGEIHRIEVGERVVDVGQFRGRAGGLQVLHE